MKRTTSIAGGLLVGLLALAGCGGDTTIAVGQGTLTFSPAEVVDLPATPVGGETLRTLYVDNTGGAAVTINSISLQEDATGYFTLSGADPGTIEKGEGMSIDVTYRPASPGLHSVTLSVTSNGTSGGDDATRTVLLRGQAAAPVVQAYPAVVDFGVVSAGEEQSRTVTLVADAIVPLTVMSVSLEGTAGFEHSLPAATELPFSVLPDETLSVQVRYQSDGEAAEGLLRIASDAAAHPELTIALRGNQCLDSEGASFDADADGFSLCGGDCDDDLAAVHPGAVESFDAGDNDCGGLVDEGTTGYDDDGDGLSELDGDCYDGDPNSFPGAVEVVDGIDNDCDGVVDDGTEELDDDGDGFSELGGDCDDSDPTVHPAAAEVLDGIDNDCDGQLDEGSANYDDDSDTFTENSGDCHDGDPNIYPGAIEVANGVDDDCDGAVDEGTTWADDDGDGFTEAGGDCDDGDAAVHPGATDTPGDGQDSDCDGIDN